MIISYELKFNSLLYKFTSEILVVIMYIS
jgi:hypothetical protein